MSIQKKRFIVNLILVITGGLYIYPAQAADTMYFSALENSGPQEVAKLVLREAYERIGVSAQFKPMPGERALIESNLGRTDGEVARISGIEKKYDNLIRIPIAISRLEGVAFSIDPDLSVNGWNSLKDYRIGAFTGSKFVERNTRGMDVDYSPGVKNLFSMLERDRVDMIIIPYLSGLKYIKDQSLVGFTRLTPPLIEIKLYHYLNKKHLEILPRITKALEAMENENRIRALRNGFISELIK